MKPSIEAKVLLALGALALVAFIAIAVNGTGGGGEDDSSVREATPPASTAKDETVHRQPEEEKPAPEKKEPVVPTIVVRGGEPVGGVAELSFDAGEVVRFKVESDVADELHLHGYEAVGPHPVKALSDALAYDVEQGQLQRVRRGVYAAKAPVIPAYVERELNDDPSIWFRAA